jgi:hypothetical protein
MQLGLRQARYFGRTKTLFQLLMAATVANLTLVATKVGLMRGRGGRAGSQSSLCAHLAAHFAALILALTLLLACYLDQTTDSRLPGGVVG